MKTDKYIKDVLRLLNANKQMKKRIEEDLQQRIQQAQEEDPYFDVLQDLGTPEMVAADFMEQLNVEQVEGVKRPYQLEPYEFKSKSTLFGIPFVHIHVGGRYQTKVARGIIALGDVAQGVVAIGGVSLGVISIGGVGIGLLSLAGVSIGGLALGGVAFGGYAIGGVAIGLLESIGAVIRTIF
jgi:hypothetical protein